MTARPASPSLRLPPSGAVSGAASGRASGPTGIAGSALKSVRLPWPLLVYLFVVIVPIGFYVGPLAMTNVRLFLMIMVLPLLFNLLRGAYGRLVPADIFFPLHIVWAVVALSVNNPSRVVEQIGSVAVEFLGGYLLGRAFIRTPEAFFALARVLVVIMICMLPLAVFETLTGRPLLVELILKGGFISVGNTVIDARMGLERVQLAFAHPIHFGLFCSVAFGCAFVALKDQTSTAWRYVSSAVIAFCLFLSLSSGPLLALMLQCMLIAWATAFAGVRQRWYVLLGVVALLYVVLDVLSTRTPIQVFMSYATFSAHNAYWRGQIFDWGMNNVWANPLFGLGLNDWVRPAYMYSGSMDNFWLLMGVRYGIPGFLLLAAGYILGLALVIRRDFSADPQLRQIRLAWVFIFVGLTFTLCTVAIWTNIYSFVFFLFGTGMWLITAQPAGTPAAAADPQRGPAPRRSAVLPSALAPALADTARAVSARPPAAAAEPPATTSAGPRYTRFPPESRPSPGRPVANR